MTATQELVVPRSMPITLAMSQFLSLGMDSWPLSGALRSIPLNSLIKQALSQSPC